MVSAILGRVLPALILLAVAMPALGAPYAAIVIDARNGAVLHARNADSRLHPASLTKMMTLYLVFEALQAGRLDLDQKVTISRHAASQPPSRIGLRAGQKAVIRDLIRAAAIKSANDAATALAEAVAGSEREFARMMTARAAALGMRNSSFRNANGLTASGHFSSARDMAVLGRRLFYDFPDYYNLFGRQEAPALGRTIRNTNRLLTSYSGADGIKTGYTRAAGYNLVASAERDGKRVIAVVFGGRSSRDRNQKVADLLDLGFDAAPVAVALERLAPLRDPRVREAGPPPPRAPAPESLVALGVRAIEEAVVPAAAAAETPPPRLAASETAPAESARPQPRPTLEVHLAINTRPLRAPTWSLHLGNYKDKAYARRLVTRAAAVPALKQAEPSVDRTVVKGLTLYSARLTGLSPSAARSACEALRRVTRRCRAVPARQGS
ncbi:MAG TPA: D-alanyl-D-alanine carboxypeptidase family protein [Paracoccaceae bacterium]|nr:D-alanyl-D-alanine carboxypeptidase family protein [Paracoccaceae bacterium]